MNSRTYFGDGCVEGAYANVEPWVLAICCQFLY